MQPESLSRPRLRIEPCASVRAGQLGASDGLSVQPKKATIELRDVVRLSQDGGRRRSQDRRARALGHQSDGGDSHESPSGFTIPIPPSDDSNGTNRSSMDFQGTNPSNRSSTDFR